MIDGRHRVLACIESDVPFKAFVVWGVHKEGQYTKDTGLPRNTVQYLDKHNYKHPRALNSAAKILHRMNNTTNGKDGLIGSIRDRVPHKDLMLIIENLHPEIQDSVNRIYPDRTDYFTTSIHHLIVLDYLTRYLDGRPDIADEFLNVFSGRKYAENDHPVKALRNHFYRTVVMSKQRLKSEKQVAYMIIAYNYLKDNKSAKRLHITKKEPKILFLSARGDS